MQKSIMNPKLRDFWQTRSRYKILFGGRASSKSWDIALQCIKLSSNYSLKFMCLRRFQNNIKESVYTLLKEQIWRLGLQEEYNILSSSIEHKIPIL